MKNQNKTLLLITLLGIGANTATLDLDKAEQKELGVSSERDRKCIEENLVEVRCSLRDNLVSIKIFDPTDSVICTTTLVGYMRYEYRELARDFVLNDTCTLDKFMSYVKDKKVQMNVQLSKFRDKVGYKWLTIEHLPEMLKFARHLTKKLQMSLLEAFIFLHDLGRPDFMRVNGMTEYMDGEEKLYSINCMMILKDNPKVPISRILCKSKSGKDGWYKSEYSELTGFLEVCNGKEYKLPDDLMLHSLKIGEKELRFEREIPLFHHTIKYVWQMFREFLFEKRIELSGRYQPDIFPRYKVYEEIDLDLQKASCDSYWLNALNESMDLAAIIADKSKANMRDALLATAIFGFHVDNFSYDMPCPYPDVERSIYRTSADDCTDVYSLTSYQDRHQSLFSIDMFFIGLNKGDAYSLMDKSQVVPAQNTLPLQKFFVSSELCLCNWYGIKHKEKMWFQKLHKSMPSYSGYRVISFTFLDDLYEFHFSDQMKMKTLAELIKFIYEVQTKIKEYAIEANKGIGRETYSPHEIYKMITGNLGKIFAELG